MSWAVAAYKRKCSKKEGVDARVLSEWEFKVNECTERQIRLLGKKYVNRRKWHLLASVQRAYRTLA